jgi:hypothetical protein
MKNKKMKKKKRRRRRRRKDDKVACAINFLLEFHMEKHGLVAKLSVLSFHHRQFLRPRTMAFTFVGHEGSYDRIRILFSPIGLDGFVWEQ